MRILLLGQHPELPSTRYRVKQFVPHFHRRDIETRFEIVPDTFSKRRSLFKEAGEYDIVFLQGKLFQPWEFGLLRRHAPRIVFDIDDSIMFRHSKTGDFFSWSRWLRFRFTVTYSDVVIAGNDYLAYRALEYNENVVVIPSVIDLRDYPEPEEDSSHDNFTLGWIGTSSNLGYLESLRPVLEEIGKEYDDAVLRIICDEFFDLDHLPVEKKEWGRDTEIEDLRSVDVGIMMLPRTVWTLGKCGFKLIQYLALEIPAITSPVGVNREIIIPGYTGLRASDDEDWLRSIQTAYENRDRLSRWGSNGREYVRENYCVRSQLPRYMDLFRTLVEKP